MEAAPSKEEQQEFAFWNATLSAVAPNSTTLLESMTNKNGTGAVEVYDGDTGFGGRDWLALFFMTFGKDLTLRITLGQLPFTEPADRLRFHSHPHTGWVLLFTSIVGFWRVKRWEASIRATSHHQAPVNPGDLAREVQVRRNLESIFGIGAELETEVDSHMEAEVRLARHLRAAGLL